MWDIGWSPWHSSKREQIYSLFLAIAKQRDCSISRLIVGTRMIILKGRKGEYRDMRGRCGITTWDSVLAHHSHVMPQSPPSFGPAPASTVCLSADGLLWQRDHLCTDIHGQMLAYLMGRIGLLIRFLNRLKLHIRVQEQNSLMKENPFCLQMMRYS